MSLKSELWTLLKQDRGDYYDTLSGPENVRRLLAWCDLVTTDYTGLTLSPGATLSDVTRLSPEVEAGLCQWWTGGHGLCAVIARFRPDLLQYHSLGIKSKIYTKLCFYLSSF